MYIACVLIQIFCIVGVWFESVLVLNNGRKRIHMCLFLYCISVVVSCSGYLVVMLSKSFDGAVSAYKMACLGNVWIAFSFALFTMELCEVHLHRFIRNTFVVVQGSLWILTVTNEYHHLTFSSVGFADDGMFPHLIPAGGPAYYVYTWLNLFYGGVVILLLTRNSFTARNRYDRRRYLTVLLAALVQISFYVIAATVAIDEYDDTNIGFAISTLILYLAISRYDLLDTRELAQEFVIDNISEAIVAVDKYNRIALKNKTAEEIFPYLGTEPDSTLNEIREFVRNREILKNNGRIYRPQENKLVKNNKTAGTAYVFKDETELVKQSELREENLKMLYLKSQINPHFLYNTLDAIRINAQINDDTGTSEMLMSLVDFFRLIVKSNNPVVELDHEIDLLEAYLDLMQYRYPQLKTELDVPEGYLDIDIPNFVLQPIVENSLSHGLRERGYNGTVKVSVHPASDDMIEICICDDGIGFDDKAREYVKDILEHYDKDDVSVGSDRKHESIGIRNVQRRLKMFYPEPCGLSYTENPDGGVTAHILIFPRIIDSTL